MDAIRSEHHRVDDVYTWAEVGDACTVTVIGGWALCQHTRGAYWQSLKLATRYTQLIYCCSLTGASLVTFSSTCKLSSAVGTSPRRLVGQSRDRLVTWRQDGAERRHSSGGSHCWTAWNETWTDYSHSVWRLLPQPVGSTYSRWTWCSSARC